MPLPKPYRPYFDCNLQYWILTSYHDVRLALEDPRFSISPVPMDEALHTAALRAAMTAFDLGAWTQDLPSIPFALEKNELVAEVAEPWCHAAALRLVGLQDDNGRLLCLSQRAFAAGARPWNALDANASMELAALLPPVLGPVTTQAFIAVSQTLTAFLTNAWAMLLEQRLREAPLEELLRVAGPSQLQFRYFEGLKIALSLYAANRDPDRFGANAGRIDPSRDAKGHLAFGMGAHACLGAMLVRTAARIVMPLFAQHYGGATLTAVEMPEEPVAIRKPIAVRIALP